MLSERLRARTTAAMAFDDPAFIERVLKLRASRLAAPRRAADDPVAAGQAVLCVAVGAELYGLALEDISEVMPLTMWTPVPGVPQQVLGVMNVRGEIRPVLDLHSMLGLAVPEGAQRRYVAFLRSAGREIGLRVDGLERIAFVDPATLTRPHEAGNGLPQRFVAGITPETLILLDARQILSLDVLRDRRAEYRAI